MLIGEVGGARPGWGWPGSVIGTPRGGMVGRRTATLMYAGQNRRSAPRRKVPLTKVAPAWPSQRAHGDRSCSDGAPAWCAAGGHRGADPGGDRWPVNTSGRHLGPQEPGELSGDRGDDHVGGVLAGGQPPKRPHRRQVVFTEPILDLPDHLPMIIDFPSTFYFHGEGRGLVLGFSDPDQQPGFNLDYETEDWLPRLFALVERRAPSILDAGLTTGWAGLYEITPDQNQIIGEDGEVSRFLYATGFSGHGFLMGPAVGEIIRDLYLGRSPLVDISGLDVRRFSDPAAAVTQEHNIV